MLRHPKLLWPDVFERRQHNVAVAAAAAAANTSRLEGRLQLRGALKAGLLLLLLLLQLLRRDLQQQLVGGRGAAAVGGDLGQVEDDLLLPGGDCLARGLPVLVHQDHEGGVVGRGGRVPGHLLVLVAHLGNLEKDLGWSDEFVT